LEIPVGDPQLAHETPQPRKRKKYTARQGMTCPKCGENLRTLFITLNAGGLRALPYAGGCPKCLEIYKYHITIAPEIAKVG
jgi:ssDNA-binding Zn-finger/Zn-ribbon topoisomerase 1